LNYQLVISELAKAQLEALYYYIAEHGSADIAKHYIKEIVDYFNNLCIFSLRGTLRNDLRSGLRITSYRKRVTIAFKAQENKVIIIDIFYAGQDYETLLSGDNSTIN